jgi:TolB-like protein
MYALGPFRLDVETEILLRNGEPLPVGKRAVALLRVLVERAGMPVSKDALLEAAWAGLVVEESNLPVQIAAVRKVLGQVPGGERWIETLPRRGYRFVGPVETCALGSTVVGPERLLPGKPSIAVLPFTNLGGDPNEDYFSDGITEDIITELSRFSELFVIARNSSFTYKGKAVDVRQVGRELGVRYVLEGSIRRAGDRVRITAQLVDATTAAHLWGRAL